MVELDIGKSPTQVQSMQLHKLLDLNEDKKPNDMSYEVRMTKICYLNNLNTYYYISKSTCMKYTGFNWKSRVDV